MIVGAPKRKESWEIIPWEVDTAKLLDPGETITGVAFSAWSIPDDVDVTLALQEGVPTQDGTKWRQWIKGGIDGAEYWLELYFTTSLGARYEGEVKLRVRDLP